MHKVINDNQLIIESFVEVSSSDLKSNKTTATECRKNISKSNYNDQSEQRFISQEANGSSK